MSSHNLIWRHQTPHFFVICGWIFSQLLTIRNIYRHCYQHGYVLSRSKQISSSYFAHHLPFSLVSEIDSQPLTTPLHNHITLACDPSVISIISEHGGKNKISNTSTTFLKIFSSKIIYFDPNITHHRGLLLTTQLTVWQICSGNGLAPNNREATLFGPMMTLVTEAYTRHHAHTHLLMFWWCTIAWRHKTDIRLTSFYSFTG